MAMRTSYGLVGDLDAVEDGAEVGEAREVREVVEPERRSVAPPRREPAERVLEPAMILGWEEPLDQQEAQKSKKEKERERLSNG